MRESAVDRYLVDEVTKAGGWALKIPTSYISGLPDRLILLRGRAFFCEIKAPGEKARPLQRAVHAKLSSCGFTVAILDSKTKIDSYLNDLKC